MIHYSFTFQRRVIQRRNRHSLKYQQERSKMLLLRCQLAWDTDSSHDTVYSRYISVIILINAHRCPIAHLWGWAMGCLLWVQSQCLGMDVVNVKFCQYFLRLCRVAGIIGAWLLIISGLKYYVSMPSVHPSTVRRHVETDIKHHLTFRDKYSAMPIERDRFSSTHWQKATHS